MRSDQLEKIREELEQAQTTAESSAIGTQLTRAADGISRQLREAGQLIRDGRTDAGLARLADDAPELQAYAALLAAHMELDGHCTCPDCTEAHYGPPVDIAAGVREFLADRQTAAREGLDR